MWPVEIFKLGRGAQGHDRHQQEMVSEVEYIEVFFFHKFLII